MRGLILRLSEIDSSAEAAMRVVAYFDALVQGGAPLEAVVRSTASLVGARAGFTDAITGEVVSSDGAEPAEGPVLSTDVSVSGTAVGLAWLDGDTESAELDELVLERMALTIAALWPGQGRWLPSDALTLMRPDASDAAREAARRRLHLSATERRSAIVVLGAEGRGTRMSDSVRSHLVGGGRVEAVVNDGEELVLLVRGDVEAPLLADVMRDAGCAAGSCGAADVAALPQARRDASAAARLADAAPGLLGSFVRAEEIGALLRLVDVPADLRGADRDVRTLLDVAASRRGDDLDLLEAFLSTGTLRAAGERVHRHHSSVASRLERLEKELGLVLDEPLGRTRAYAGLLLTRLTQRDEDRKGRQAST